VPEWGGEGPSEGEVGAVRRRLGFVKPQELWRSQFSVCGTIGGSPGGDLSKEHMKALVLTRGVSEDQ